MDEMLFQQGMMELSGAYPREFELTDTMNVVWLKYLDHLDGETFVAIVDGWIRTEPHAPSISQVLTRGGAAVTGIGGDEAWALVHKSVMHGAYRQPDFRPDDRINEAVRMCGGWRLIAGTDEEKLHYVKREFMQHFERIPTRALAVR